MKKLNKVYLPLNTRVFLFLALLILFHQPVSAQEGSLKWTFETGGDIDSSPAIGNEGIIYFGSRDDHLYAVQPDGTEKWRFDSGAGIVESPVIAEDGTIYVGNNDGKVFALNPDGTLKWTFDSELDDQVQAEMALAADGTLYTSIGGVVYALNPDGTIFWTFDPAGTIRGLAIGLNGVVTLSESNGRIYALSSQGELQWDVDYTNGINSHPIFDENGTIYVASNSEVLAIDPSDGSLIWEVSTEGSRESPSIGVNGDLYVPIAESATAGAVLALNPSDGSLKWSYNVPAQVVSSPTVGFDGTIYVGTDNEELLAITPTGSLKWSLEVEQDIESSAAIAPDGTIYIGNDDENLYAVRSSSAGLAASAWPKKQRDNRNTGRFGSDVTRRQWFAPHVYWLSEDDVTVVTVRHIGGAAGQPAGTTASFTIEVRNRDGSLFYTLDDSVEPGETKDIVLEAPQPGQWAGSVIIDAPIKDGTYLAPFLTWQLTVKSFVKPLQIGAFFSDPTEAALVHHFPAEATADNGLGLGVQNIGENEIDCSLEFFNGDGSMASEEVMLLSPKGSVVQFFNSSVPEGFKGSATFSCDAPVVVIAVNQDAANGGFVTDRLTIKGQQ